MNDEPYDWHLLMVGTSPDEPERTDRFLAGAILSCGGWILNSRTTSDTCTELDFEFLRANCVEIYSVLVASGVELSADGHQRMTELCQCTQYLLASKSYDVVRMHLTVFSSSLGYEANVEELGEAREEAA